MAVVLKTITPPRPDRLKQILAGLARVRAGLAGDLALDAYWHADLTKSELSLETPHFPLPVVQESYAPGAGGNVAANLAALGLKSVAAAGVIGQDWRGRLLAEELFARNIAIDGLIKSDDRVTNAYIKPYRRGFADLEYEDPRLDFTNHSSQSELLDQVLARQLTALARHLDVLCLSDQFQYGCLGPAVQKAALELARQGLLVLVDSRYRIGMYPGCLLKPNAAECAQALGKDMNTENAGLEQLAGLALELAAKTTSTVCLTAGARGCFLTGPDQGAVSHVPVFPVQPPLDICGAGDSFMATFAACLGAGATKAEAAFLANAAAAVTVKKLKQTGTASLREIQAVLHENGHV